MDKFLFYDEPDPEVLPVEDAGPDYSQLLYDYLVSQDNLSGTVQEEYYAAYSEKLDSIDSQLQLLNENLEWTVAFLLLLSVLILFRSVRGWVTVLTGGSKDVY